MGILAGLVAALAWTVASSLWRGLSTSLNAIQLNGL
ncbi:MAG: EamA family transporter, partial [Stappia sp.]|nr:EamA family transporter [Stappia sp.]